MKDFKEILPNITLKAMMQGYDEQLKAKYDGKVTDGEVSEYVNTMFFEVHGHRYYFDGDYYDRKGFLKTVWTYYGVKTKKFSSIVVSENDLNKFYRYE